MPDTQTMREKPGLSGRLLAVETMVGVTNRYEVERPSPKKTHKSLLPGQAKAPRKVPVPTTSDPSLSI